MAKRIADKELTDRNWDQEEEGEEAGTFSIASDDVMKNRAIKKAKRRNIGAEGEASGAFKGFKGFALSTGSPAASLASTPTAFSGFGNGGGFKGLTSLTNGNSITSPFGGFSSPAASTASPGLTFNSPASVKPTADISTKQTNGSAPSPAQSLGFGSSSSVSNKEYSRQLTALNCSVRDWITKHVNDNPLCDLNPIFRDYERHLASIERKYGASSADGGAEEKKASSSPLASSSSPSSSSSSAPAPAASLFSFSKSSTDDSAREKSSSGPGVTFNFGQKVDSSVLASLGSKSTPPSFSFSSSASSSTTSLFGAPGSAPLSFSANKTSDAQPTDENGDEESEEPPKPEVKEVKEDDAFYSKKYVTLIVRSIQERCKLFYKKGAEFKEKGVGTLHLKETEDGKTQMIIRADTNLGNILLNILVQSSMPFSRVGKNNVMVVCVPNPPVDDKNPTSPVPLLIRVKTTEDANALHGLLEEKKGGTPHT